MNMNFLESIIHTNAKLENVSTRLDLLTKVFDNKEVVSQMVPKYAGFIYNDNIEVATVFQSENTTITYVLWKLSHLTYPAHKHIESIEYLIVISGSFLVKFGEASRIMIKGECISLPIGCIHSCTSLEDMSEMFGICIPPEQAYKREDDNDGRNN